MTSAALVAGFATLVNGVAAGVMLSTVIGIVPLFLSLDYRQYVTTVQFMWPRYDPFMPLANGVTLALDILLAAALPEPAVNRVWHAVAAGLLAAVMTISITRNVPVNRFVSGLDPDVRPQQWETTDPRRRWRNWNLLRTGLALLALVANVFAIVGLA
jgi:uncharacterized membrane protein